MRCFYESADDYFLPPKVKRFFMLPLYETDSTSRPESPNTNIWYGYDDQEFVEFITRFKVDLGPAARAALDMIYGKMYVDYGDGGNDDYFADLNVKPLKALFTAFSGEHYPDPPPPTPHWEL